MIYFGHIFQPGNPYGSVFDLGFPDSDSTPGLRFMLASKYYYHVKPTYFFLLMDKGQFWKRSFCLLPIVIKGNLKDLEFAEKSLDFGK